MINRKCHELKKQITRIQENEESEQLNGWLNELKDSIQIYDAVVKTGSEVLDVVLTEKSLYCQSCQIMLACVADGERLGFMVASDIYSLFANGLDNAIEDIRTLDILQKRQIAVSVWSKNNLLLIQLEHYFEEPAQEVSHKPDYTLKSMQYIVEKYNGFMTVHKEKPLFIVRISIPIPINTN